jgi:hypothetical protein
MTNEQYLIVSYFLCAALSVVFAILVYLFLRPPFRVMTETLSGSPFSSTLKRLFPIGLVFPALLGYVSVSYQSCGQPTYEQIVKDRGFLIAKNQEQISSIFFYILSAVLFWDLIAVLMLRYKQNGEKHPS